MSDLSFTMSLLRLLLPLSLLLLTIHTHSSSTCQPFQCGDYEISYPFSVYEEDTPEHCGLPGLLISCKYGVPFLHLKSETYKVLDIDYHNHTVTLIDADIIGQSCPRVQNNVSLFTDSGITLTASDVYLVFLFGCDLSVYPENYSPITCFPNGENENSFVLFANNTSEYADLISLYCPMVVVAPVLHDYFEQYNNNNFNISNVFGSALQSGFQLGWNPTSNCTNCERRHGQCGYVLSNDNSTSKFNCYCANGSCEGKKGHTAVVIGVSVAAAVAFFLLFIVCAVLHIRKKTRAGYAIENKKFCFGTKERKMDKLVQVALENFGSLSPKRYSFSEIRRIAKSFNHKIGQGGYASVFKGKLMDGTPVAVKVFKDRESSGVEFTTEVVSIARTSHVNIVRLVGFSISGSKRALIYEFMPNGSLDKYLCENQNSTLTHVVCARLFEIAVGIAWGLEYLHRGCNTRIVHFDIKPHDILLDQEYCPKISDFGLAKFCQPKESILSMSGLRGTIGYIAPEVFSRNFGVVLSKSDVYSYGMMVLDMFGGKQGQIELTDSSSDTYFPDYIYKCVEQKNICSVYGISDVCEEIVRKITIVGLWCIQVMPHARPTMSMVLDMLDKSIEELALPPPSNVSLTRVLVQEAIDFTSSTLTIS